MSAKGPRRRAREVAFKVLYQMESRGEEGLGEGRQRLAKLRDQAYAEALVAGCRQEKGELDRIISEASKNWALSRIPAIDKILLRIGLYEILYAHDIPRTVAINEAVRLARRYGDKKSYSFVNGILDTVKRGKGEEEE